MNKEDFIDSKMKLSKEDIIYDYYKCEEKLIEKIGIEHENYELKQENKKQKEVINKAIDKLNSFIKCCKAEKLESASDYLHNSYWDMFERFNKQIKDILKEEE